MTFVLQLLLRHGRLKMHRSQHPIPINSGGLWVVNNGLVKVTYTPNVGSEQQYFLGSGGCLILVSYDVTLKELPICRENHDNHAHLHHMDDAAILFWSSKLSSHQQPDACRCELHCLCTAFFGSAHSCVTLAMHR